MPYHLRFLQFCAKLITANKKARDIMKITVLRWIAAALLFTAAVLATAPLSVADAKDGADWMGGVEDEMLINELSIPGSHDTGAIHSIADVAGICQTLSVYDQLTVGIRFLDIRLQLVNNELKVVHSFVDQALNFDTVLGDITDFIINNPSEFLIVSIKEDADAKNSDIPFNDAVSAALSACGDRISTDRSLPKTLGEARGKIYLLSRYHGAEIGIPAYDGWSDDTSFEIGDMYVQDNYCITSVGEKKSDIMHTFDIANERRYSLVLNFTSCYIDGAFPPSYSGTPARSILPWIEYAAGESGDTLGIVIMDYVSADLAKIIYGRNYA